MNDNEVKEALGLHLAKTILAQSANSREIMTRTVVTLCTISIPGHIALLNAFSGQVAASSIFFRIGPVLCWLISLLLVSSVIFPKALDVDFKQPEDMISAVSERNNKARVVSMAAFFLAILGMIWMSSLFLGA